MCVASSGLGCALGTPVASSPCTPSTMAACAARPLAAPPSAPPAASQGHERPSAATSCTCESACAPSSCAAGGPYELGSSLRSLQRSLSQHPSSSSGRRLFAHELWDRNQSLVGLHAKCCKADAPAARAGPRAGARMPRPANSNPAGGSSRRLPACELLAKQRADDCAETGPFEYAPRPRSAHRGPAGGSGRRLYARAREQSRRNDIRRALHSDFRSDTKRPCWRQQPLACLNINSEF